MRTMIQQGLVIALLLILAVTVSGNAQAVVVPAAVSDRGREKQISSKSNAAEKFKNVDVRLRQIVEEMTLEQQRHQERLENIKKELKQIESNFDQKKELKDCLPAKWGVVLENCPE